MKIKNLIKKYSILFYFIFTFIISWSIILIIAGSENLPLDTEKNKNILPLLYTSMLLGPSISGIVFTIISDGKEGIKILLSKLIKWKFNVKWYIVALLTAPLLAALILFLLSFFSPNYYIAIIKSNNSTDLLFQGLAIGLLVGIFEEIGWSGFVIPKLGKRYNIIWNGFIVGILWGAWHFILFWESSTFTGTLPLFILIGRLFAWLPPYRIFMVWIYSRTGSLLLAILTHMSLVFTVTAIVPMSLVGKTLLTWLLMWGAALWIVIGLLIYANKNKQSLIH